MKRIIGLILARGGSKGIPNKNSNNFCGIPLIAWSILQAKNTKGISDIWVSSDSKKILKIAEKFGAKTICRPKKLATSNANGDDSYIHAINFIEKHAYIPDIIIGLQATSPIRESKDLEEGLKKFNSGKYDSLFSSCSGKDTFFWKESKKILKSVNYNYKKRSNRQDLVDNYVIENGSFFIFTPKLIKKLKNRLGGKIGTYVMESWKLFELDELSDIKLCELIMKNFILNQKRNRLKY